MPPPPPGAPPRPPATAGAPWSPPPPPLRATAAQDRTPDVPLPPVAAFHVAPAAPTHTATPVTAWTPPVPPLAATFPHPSPVTNGEDRFAPPVPNVSAAIETTRLSSFALPADQRMPAASPPPRPPAPTRSEAARAPEPLTRAPSGGGKSTKPLTLGVAALLLAPAGGGYFWSASHPRIRITNPLPVPISAVISNNHTEQVAPHSAVVVRLPAQADSMQLTLVQNGAKVTALDAFHRVAQPSNAFAIGGVAANNVFGNEQLFFPLVTNLTQDNLSITVMIDGVPHACECTVSPGARRQVIGAFPLGHNVEVHAARPEGGTAVFRNFASNTKASTGEIGFKFADADFAAPSPTGVPIALPAR